MFAASQLKTQSFLQQNSTDATHLTFARYLIDARREKRKKEKKSKVIFRRSGKLPRGCAV
jgi:hypothetical protein